MLNSVRNKVLVATAVGMTILSAAAPAFADDPAPDPITGVGGVIPTVQAQLLGYAAPIAGALLVIGLAFVGVRLVPRVIRMIASRLG